MDKATHWAIQGGAASYWIDMGFYLWGEGRMSAITIPNSELVNITSLVSGLNQCVISLPPFARIGFRSTLPASKKRYIIAMQIKELMYIIIISRV